MIRYVCSLRGKSVQPIGLRVHSCTAVGLQLSEMFTGSVGNKRRVDLRGNSKGSESREQVLERSRRDRERRKQVKLENTSATAIQVRPESASSNVPGIIMCCCKKVDFVSQSALASLRL